VFSTRQPLGGCFGHIKSRRLIAENRNLA